MIRKILGIISLAIGIFFGLGGFIAILIAGGNFAQSILVAILGFGIWGTLGVLLLFTKIKNTTFAMIGGIALIVLGINSIIQGSNMNQDIMAILQYGPNPGNSLIAIGILLAIGGIVVGALGYWKRYKNT